MLGDKVFNDLFTDDNGIIKRIFSIDRIKAAAMFGALSDEEIKDFDGFISFNIYDKTLNNRVSSFILNDDNIDSVRDKVTKYFLFSHYDTIVDVKKLLDKEINNLLSNTRTETSNDNETIDDSGKNETNETNKIFGFNSETPADESANSSNSSNSSSLKKQLLATKETTENNTGRSAVSLINEQLQFYKNTFYNIVVEEVKNFFTLAIYN